MRILEIETFGRGGLIHYAYNLSCALAERGHQVTLVTAPARELRPNSSIQRAVRRTAADAERSCANGSAHDRGTGHRLPLGAAGLVGEAADAVS